MTSPPTTGADLMDDQGLSAAEIIRAWVLKRFGKHIRHNSARDLVRLLDAARADTRSPSPGDVREGFVLVPREMTEAMFNAGQRQAEECTADFTMRSACIPEHVWHAMIAAAPSVSALPIQGGGWRPIEEAPAENALLYWPETNTLCARWSIGFPHDHGAHRSPSHFWPLPNPPKDLP